MCCSSHGGHAPRASDAMKQYLLYAGSDTELLDDEMIEARVGGVGARGGDYVGNIVHTSSPFFDGLLTGIDRQSHALLPEDIIQFLDTWCIGVIDEWMVDISDGCSSLDASETVDGEDLLESEGIDKQPLVRAETTVNSADEGKGAAMRERNLRG